MEKRNIEDVIDQLLAVIPQEETAFRANLAKVQNRVGFTAPEAMTVCWQELSSTVNHHVLKEEWQRKAVSILMGGTEA